MGEVVLPLVLGACLAVCVQLGLGRAISDGLATCLSGAKRRVAELRTGRVADTCGKGNDDGKI